MKDSALHRRLLPLYIVVFCQGFVLWYATEKLFMRQIGFDDATIGFMVTLYAIITLVVEVPSGILADRWSRKGVLVLASVALAGSSFICGISTNVPLYMIGAICWGAFYAMHASAYTSLVYDVLLEEHGNARKFDRIYGYIRGIKSLALVAGALAGGLVATVSGARNPFLWTVPIAIVSLLALAVFREPTLHRRQKRTSIRGQLGATFTVLLWSRRVLPTLITLVMATVASTLLLEFAQLWLLAIDLPVIFWGPFDAALVATIGLGGLLAARGQLHKRPRMNGLLVAGCVAGFGLVFIRSPLFLCVAMMLVLLVMYAIDVIFNKLLHDELPSHLRTGAASAVRSLSHMLLVPIALVFGWSSTHHGIFTAAWIEVELVIATLACVAWALWLHRRQKMSDTPVRKAYAAN